MDEKKEERVVIDLRRNVGAPTKELVADLVMEIDIVEGGFQATYSSKQEDGTYKLVFQRMCQTREQLIDAHIEAIKQAKPASALVRTGRHSSGHQRDIMLNPGVVKMILEDKLQAAHLLPRG